MSSTGAERVNFFERMEEASSVRATNLRGGKSFGRSLSGVAVVGFDDAAKLVLASNASGELGPEGLVQNLVVYADTPMRA